MLSQAEGGKGMQYNQTLRSKSSDNNEEDTEIMLTKVGEVTSYSSYLTNQNY